MDLSGLMIRGTGSYEVKEISVEGGNLLLKGSGIQTSGGWSKVGNNYHLEGDAATSYLSNLNIVTIGKNYKVKYHILENPQLIGLRFDTLNFTTVLSADSAVGWHEYEAIAITDDFYLRSRAALEESGLVIDYISLEEIPEGYPLMDKGDTYLECTSVGTVALPQPLAFMECEFDWYKLGVLTVFFIQNTADSSSLSGYNITINGDENIRLQEKGVSNHFITANSYIANSTWYRIKITRTLDGEFYVYIRGGAFGNNDWTPIVASSGSNPITDTSYITSKYFVIEGSVGDRIANIITRKAVKQ